VISLKIWIHIIIALYKENKYDITLSLRGRLLLFCQCLSVRVPPQNPEKHSLEFHWPKFPKPRIPKTQNSHLPE
jgi:hypothetical protein